MFSIPAPDLQIEFSLALAEIRRLYLQDALQDTVRNVRIIELDQELGSIVPAENLSIMAAHSLRGELIFPAPIILRANPYLLGYYRLLYGFSQKVFYTSATGVGSFKGMEERGVISAACDPRIEDLCAALIPCGAALLDGIGPKRISLDLLDNLTLLTVGPNLGAEPTSRRGPAASSRYSVLFMTSSRPQPSRSMKAVSP